MGYILPINHIQAIQYRNRLEPGELKPIEFPRQKLRIEPLRNQTKMHGHGKITRKGRFFDEYI